MVFWVPKKFPRLLGCRSAAQILGLGFELVAVIGKEKMGPGHQTCSTGHLKTQTWKINTLFLLWF